MLKFAKKIFNYFIKILKEDFINDGNIYPLDTFVDRVFNMYNQMTKNANDHELFRLTMSAQSKNVEIANFMLKHYTKPYCNKDVTLKLLCEHNLLVKYYPTSDMKTLKRSEGTNRWILFDGVYEYFKQCKQLDGNGVKEGLDELLFLNVYKEILQRKNLIPMIERETKCFEEAKKSFEPVFKDNKDNKDNKMNDNQKKFEEFTSKHTIPLTKKFAKQRYTKFGKTMGTENDFGEKEVESYSAQELMSTQENQIVTNVFSYYRFKMFTEMNDKEIFLEIERFRSQWDDRPNQKPLPNDLNLYSYILYRSQLEFEELGFKVGDVGLTETFINDVINETCSFIDNNY